MLNLFREVLVQKIQTAIFLPLRNYKKKKTRAENVLCGENMN